MPDENHDDGFHVFEAAYLETFGKKESWLQNFIAQKPEVLRLGEDVFVRDQERRQPTGGRLDLLLESDDNERRWVVELQLGATDPSHIVRLIEYWKAENDSHRYDHRAVLVAEEITGRFFDVVTLLGQRIPIVAIKVTASRCPQCGGEPRLLFTKIFESHPWAPEEDDSKVPNASRDKWVQKARASISAVEEIFERCVKPHGEWELTWKVAFVGLKKSGSVNNAFQFKPKLQFFHIRPRVERRDDFDKRLEALGWEFDFGNDGFYRLRRLPNSSDLPEKGYALLNDMFLAAIGNEQPKTTPPAGEEGETKSASSPDADTPAA